MTGVESAAAGVAAQLAANWASYQTMLRANSSASGDIASLEAMAATLGRSQFIAQDYEAVRQYDLANAQISGGLLTAQNAAQAAANTQAQETTPQAVAALQASQAAAMAALVASEAATQQTLNTTLFNAQNAYKSGVAAVAKVNALINANPQLFGGQALQSVSALT